MFRSIDVVKEKLNRKEDTIESISVQEICVGARLCKVSFWCLCLFCVGAPSCIRRRYRTAFRSWWWLRRVFTSAHVHVWVKVQRTSDKQPTPLSPCLSPLFHGATCFSPLLFFRPLGECFYDAHKLRDVQFKNASLWIEGVGCRPRHRSKLERYTLCGQLWGHYKPICRQ